MPGGSWFPLIAAFGFALGGFGIIMNDPTGGYSAEFLAEYDVPAFTMLVHRFKFALVGGLIGVLGVFAWSMEPIGGYNIHFDDEDDKAGAKAVKETKKASKKAAKESAKVEAAAVESEDKADEKDEDQESDSEKKEEE